MAQNISNIERWERRKHRTRTRIKQNPGRCRLAVFRSNKHIYAQLIDDAASRVIISVSDKISEESASELEAFFKDHAAVIKELSAGRAKAYKTGLSAAWAAKKHNVSAVVFDRGGYRYHGRVKSLAEGARAGGLQF